MIFVAIPDGWRFVAGERKGRLLRTVSEGDASDETAESSAEGIRRSVSTTGARGGCGAVQATQRLASRMQTQ